MEFVDRRRIREIGKLVRNSLSEGYLRDAVLRGGPDAYTWPPTSGNAWARRFIEQVFPIPEKEFRTCPDLYLAALAPLYGTVKRIEEPQGFWRYHPANANFCDEFPDNLAENLARAEECIRAIEQHAARQGLRVDNCMLRFNSRWHQIQEATRTIRSIVPMGDSFILVDENSWNTSADFFRRRRFLFLESNGKFTGCPPDDEMAIRELARLREEGARFIVFVWPIFVARLLYRARAAFA